MTERVSRMKALSHQLRLEILVALETQGKMRTSDLAESLGAAANKVSYHLSILDRAGYLEKETGEDARETWWKINDAAVADPIVQDEVSQSDDPGAVGLVMLDHLADLVRRGVADSSEDGSLALTHANLTDEQARQFGSEIIDLVTRARDLSRENRKKGIGTRYALGAQLLPVHAEHR